MYVNAFLEGDDVVVIERIDGERFIRREPVDWSFYVKDRYGEYESIYGAKLRKIQPQNRQEFYFQKKQFKSDDIYESDVNRVHKYLSENYGEEDIPELKIGYLDIEVAYTQENKYSNPDDALNDIISVAVTDKDTEITRFLTLPPITLSYQEAVDIVDSVTPYGEVFATEPDLINRMLDLIQEFDVISGWNSESYDIKYIINRIYNIMNPKIARRLCLCDQEPKPKKVENKKFKKIEEFYDLVGRVHLDYMQLYKKYTYNEVPGGYSLDNIAYMELDETKVPYSGTLDQLYKQDFEKFVRYNIQDTELILRLDKKLKFIDTTNIRAHQNGVILPAAMGTVGIVEQAIINEGHRYFGQHFDDKKEIDGDVSGAAGAFVVDPKKGIRRFVAGNDINSLYPSVIRALNMSPETLIGQVSTDRTDETILELVNSGKAETFSEAWRTFFSTLEFEDVINQRDTEIEFEINATKEVMVTTGKKIYEMVFNGDDFNITANGTVFTRKKQGIIPHLLERWYSDRKKMQKDAGEWEGKMMAATPDTDEYNNSKYWYEYWDQRQLAKKIDLNSLYGALLNKHCRFYDKRLGQSTTLTGRSITRHMAAKINEIITGEYDYVGKSIIYGDTDSVNDRTKVELEHDSVEIGKLFHDVVKTEGDIFHLNNSEYVFPDGLNAITYNNHTGQNESMAVDYVYRHKVEKEMFEIEDEYGNIVTVTEDHSIMVERDGKVVEAKPTEILNDDFLISI